MAMRGSARFIRHRATRGLSSMLIRRSISQTSSFRSLFQSNTMNTRPRHVETEDQIKGMMGGITFTDVAIDGQGYRFANLLRISGQPSSTPAQPDSAEQCEPAHKPVKHLGSTLRITRFPASSFEQTTSLIGPWLRGRTGPSAMHRGTGTGGSNPTCSSGEGHANHRFLSG
jgi:hypothetical protein